MKTEADVQVLPADYAAKLFSRIIVRKFAVEVDCARQQKRAKKEIHASAKHSVVVQRASQGALGERFPSIAENSVVEVGVRTSFEYAASMRWSVLPLEISPKSWSGSPTSTNRMPGSLTMKLRSPELPPEAGSLVANHRYPVVPASS